MHLVGWSKMYDERIKIDDISSRLRDRSKYAETGPEGPESLRSVRNMYGDTESKIQSDLARICPCCQSLFLQKIKTKLKKKDLSKQDRKCRYCAVDIMKHAKYFGCSCKADLAVCTSCIKFHFCRLAQYP